MCDATELLVCVCVCVCVCVLYPARLTTEFEAEQLPQMIPWKCQQDAIMLNMEWLYKEPYSEVQQAGYNYGPHWLCSLEIFLVTVSSQLR